MSDTKNKNKFPVRKVIGAVLALSAGILYYTGISTGQETPSLQTFISTEENTDKSKAREEIQTADNADSRIEKKNPDNAEMKDIKEAADKSEIPPVKKGSYFDEIPNGEKTADLSSNKAVVQNEDSPVGLININTAEKDELCTLKGIGTSKADRIIEYREKNGGFKTIEEIMRVPGIKEGTFLKIKDCITV